MSELLRSVIPVLNDLGLVAEWKVISGDESFFSVTKAIHNGLQGAERSLTDARAGHLRRDERAKRRPARGALRRDRRARPAAGGESCRSTARARATGSGAVTSTPRPRIPRCGRFSVPTSTGTTRRSSPCASSSRPTFRSCASRSFPRRSTRSPRRTSTSGSTTALQVLSWIGIDLDRPLVTQISRFDPWKDPLGRHRRLQARARGGSGPPARPRRLDGARRPGRLGRSTARSRARARATR